MNIIILGGKSKRHYEWIRALKDLFGGIGSDRYAHDYLHWQTGSETVDIEGELARISQAAETREPYIIVAKSIGIVIAAMGVRSGTLSPRACVFLGIPLSVIRAEFPDFQDLVTKLPNTVFMQNENDPLGGTQELGVFLEAHHPAQWRLEQLPGDTHDYTDFESLKRIVQKIIEQ